MGRAGLLARGRIIAGAVIAVIGATVITLASNGGDPATAREQRIGLFKTECLLSHHGPDDPIVYPEAPGRSHLHAFFGNRSTDAFSTPASLRSADTTCARKTDRSAYWVPTLSRGGTRVDPVDAIAYYRVADRAPDSIQPFPGELRMIAGDAGATDTQAASVISWGCTGGGPLVPATSQGGREPVGILRSEIPGYETAVDRRKLALRRGRATIERLRRTIRRRTSAGRGIARQRRALARRRHAKRGQARAVRRAQLALGSLLHMLERYLVTGGSSIPTCRPDTNLQLLVRFPECWDGRNLDSVDHVSHMAYAGFSHQGKHDGCPSSHPVAVPKLALQIQYPIMGGPDVQLSAGGAESAHADFMNGWNQAALEKLVRDCLHADVYCAHANHGPPTSKSEASP